MSSLSLPFTARGQHGEVSVTVIENVDPARVGSVPAAAGFPMCRATVAYDGEGYLAMLGWIQNVAEASPRDGDRRFELDPFVLFEGIPTPYATFGARPELFDAPYRSDRTLSLDWVAHSFLCVAPSDPFARHVEAVAGFSWGFEMDGGRLSIVEPEQLTRDDWSAQLGLLSAAYPAWDFVADSPW